MAMKYWDMNMVKDGALYQQYKLEGRNIPSMHLDLVFEVAREIEVHILGAPNRLSNVIFDAFADAVETALDEEDLDSPDGEKHDA
jgi:hypothetical protein